MLKASYSFLGDSHSISESMVSGTVAGEMTFLMRAKRNATVVAERDSVLWKMEVQAHDEMGAKEGWAFDRKFDQILMRISSEEQEVLMVRAPFSNDSTQMRATNAFVFSKGHLISSL